MILITIVVHIQFISVIDFPYTQVSPCDGTVLHLGEVTDGLLEQIKGVDFSLEGFLGEDVASEMRSSCPEKNGEKRLCFITLYLSPGDYHHFHSPTNWKAHLRRHFPGQQLYSNFH